jgi:hypothetical protein
MTISKLFWGVSLIVLGLSFLLHNFNPCRKASACGR